ncbi:MAG TPA: hypothetical protein VFM18_20500, partial [Methanosarcina sp.]|nr:hypothetical protein [Methanosarcina sp.]
RYRDEPQNSRGYNLAKFNILWSNVQTAIPAVYSRLPQPDVSRRFKDNDPVGRVAALLLERALAYEIDHYPDYRASMEQCVQDRFLGGRGISWVRYEPHIKTIDVPEDGFQVTEDTDEAEDDTPEQIEVIEYECSPCDYVHWKDFGHTVARTWEEVTAVWRKVYMSRDALVERFGEEIAYKIPLDTKPDEMKKSAGDGDMYEALIYEIWDKPTNKAYWLSKSLGQIVDEKEDPLELENFWPCPRPLFATLTNESLIPTPDFALYQDQANTLDVIADRIEGLIKALQVKGAYDAATPELARIFTEGESGTMIPVTNWTAFSEKNGLQGSISLVELRPIYEALNALYQAAEVQKAQIYEITGLSDIIRGQSDPRETAEAQKMKGNFGSMRLRAMQMKVAQFATELLQIKAQIICKHYQPETIIKIGGAAELSETDQVLVPQAIQLLKSADTASFRIDIAADSMVQMDEVQEKADRVEFLQAAASFFKEALPVGQQVPEMTPLLMAMLKFGVTGFKVGKTLEGEFDTTADKLKQAAEQPKQPQPDPDLIKIQAQSQAQQQQMQLDFQLKQQQSQMDMATEQHKQEAQAAQNAHQNQLEAQRAQMQAELEARLEAQRQQNDMRMAQMEQNMQLIITHLNNARAIEVAEIAAKSTMQQAQVSAAQGAQNG